jgi:RNA polymerase sigma-70 factor (ECF subfamily)
MSLQSLVAVFVTYGRQLKRTALRIVGDAHRAEDLVQDACLKALDCPPCAELAQPLSYAHRIVRNLAIDDRRRRVLEGDLFEDDSDCDAVGAPAAGPERLAMGRQQVERVVQVLAQLPPRLQKAFVLCQLDGCTQREAAAELRVSQATVHALLREALHRCRVVAQWG